MEKIVIGKGDSGEEQGSGEEKSSSRVRISERASKISATDALWEAERAKLDAEIKRQSEELNQKTRKGEVSNIFVE